MIPDTEAANVAVAKSSDAGDEESRSKESEEAEESYSRSVPTTPGNSYVEDSFVAGDDEEILYSGYESSPEKEKPRKRTKRKRRTGSPQLQRHKKLAHRGAEKEGKQQTVQPRRVRQRKRGRSEKHLVVSKPEHEPKAGPEHHQRPAAKSPTQFGSVRGATKKQKRFSFPSFTLRRKD